MAFVLIYLCEFMLTGFNFYRFILCRKAISVKKSVKDGDSILTPSSITHEASVNSLDNSDNDLDQTLNDDTFVETGVCGNTEFKEERVGESLVDPNLGVLEEKADAHSDTLSSADSTGNEAHPDTFDHICARGGLRRTSVSRSKSVSPDIRARCFKK